MIFDDRPRTRTGGALPGDRAFAYLDQSARPEAARVRAFLNGAMAQYSEPDRPAIVSRIRDERSHSDAIFELLVHEWCLRVGMQVREIEPSIAGTRTKPDFLVESPFGRFYLECVVYRGESDAEAGARSRREDVMRAVEAVRSPDFLLAVDHEGTPEKPVRTKALTDRIERWLVGLDHAQIAAATPDEVPFFEEDLGGMLLYLRPMARQETRGDSSRGATGIERWGTADFNPRETLREPLFRKAGRYGTPDLPLVIALNVADEDFRLKNAVEGLYGTECWTASRDGAGHSGRLADGVWNGPNGPQCTRLSAVLVAHRLGAWTLGQRDAVFVENFWALRPAGFVDFQVGACRREGSRLSRRDGRPLHEIFGVPHCWPETSGASTDS